jgi:two-component system, OmpR family, phosphate regulon sensor histidine kinase PhoR
MKLPLHWRIAIAFSAATTVALAGAALYMDRSFVRGVEEAERRDLVARAQLVAELLPPAPWHGGEALTSTVARADRLSGARVTLIGADGTVVADSRGDVRAMESHADRPERLEAVARGQGSAVRYSATLRMPMLYVALRAGSADDSTLRLALPLDSVWAATVATRRSLLAALMTALLLSWMLSAALANRLTRPLQEMLNVARRVSRGDVHARMPEERGGELSELAVVLNRALESSRELVTSSQRQSRYYAAILEQMTDAVVIVDSHERIQFANAVFERTFGTEAQPLEGRLVTEVALNYELAALLTRAATQGTPQQHEVRLLYPEPRTLDMVATVLTADDGGALGVLGLLHDVTEQRRMDQVRRDFVANASHELRTPAAGIRALAEVLVGGAIRDREKGPRFLGQIVEAADRLTHILDDMMTLTRVERGRELLRPQWQDARQAAEGALSAVRAAATAKGVDLTCVTVEGEQLYADPGGLRTVLANLLDNAVKYTPSGGRVAVTGHAGPSGYEISVSDTGAGIPAEDLERIFERFYRVDKARDRATGGTGLGLAIVKHIAEAHGGQVRVSSTVGSGSRFTVLFPRPAASPAAPDGSSTPSSGPSASPSA